MTAIAISQPTIDQLHAAFLTIIPRIEAHARIKIDDRSREKKEDRIAECVALAWKWFKRLAERGRDGREFPSALATFAVRHVMAGRRLCGQDAAKDVLSPRAQRMHGFKVEGLPSSTATSHDHLYGTVNGQRWHDEYEERLQDNTRTPPDEQAMFRLDFASWLRSLTARERNIIRAMARNERTRDLSKRFEVSPGRISQLRAEFKDAWQRFIGELPPREALAGAAA